MTQQGWPARLAHVIAAEIRHLREQRGLSAQQVSDRCAELGLPISRSTLADLENGRRPTLSVAELLVLARALDVPPVLLVAPVGRPGHGSVEILPGEEVSSWDALTWITGEAPGPHDGRHEDPDDRLVLLRRLDARVVTWGRIVAEGKGPSVKSAGPTEAQLSAEEEIRHDVARLRKLGYEPPDLPWGLRYLDPEAKQ